MAVASSAMRWSVPECGSGVASGAGEASRCAWRLLCRRRRRSPEREERVGELARELDGVVARELVGEAGAAALGEAAAARCHFPCMEWHTW